ncbi:MAG TPA: response regulator transcription factor [Candidatus Angelobacter sp.]|nr:response regulator transcription factor [Candidatus Angelobacter sp.]
MPVLQARVASSKESPSKESSSSPFALKTALVVDDSITILHAVCSLLVHHQIVDVVGRSESGSQAVDAVQLLRPDLLLMDADMPGMSGLRASLVISHLYPGVTIVLMSMDTDQRFVRACHDCGAHAVIYKPRFLKELAQILRTGAGQMAPRTDLPRSGSKHLAPA